MLGGNSESEGTAISADANRNIYVTGTFIGTVDFDPSAGTNELTSSGDADVFVTKIRFCRRAVMGSENGEDRQGKIRRNYH